MLPFVLVDLAVFAALLLMGAPMLVANLGGVAAAVAFTKGAR